MAGGQREGGRVVGWRSGLERWREKEAGSWRVQGGGGKENWGMKLANERGSDGERGRRRWGRGRGAAKGLK